MDNLLNNYHTISESADILGVSAMTVHRWVKRGKLKPEPAWGRQLFTLNQLRPYVVRKCATCYHGHDSVCACREQCDMETRPNKCADWRWKWS